jgi:hypothetical protein
MKGKLDKAVDKIDAILEAHFASLPPAARERKEQAFIRAAKKIDTRAKQQGQPRSADHPARAQRHA